MKHILAFLLIILGLSLTYSQDSTYILGKTDKSNSGAVYDLSDPTGVNIEVNVWGFVRLPGRYRVPLNTNFLDIMSFAGGPLENSKLEDMRIVRTEDNSTSVKVIKLNYGDLLWEDNIKTGIRLNPVLKSGDIIIVPEQRRYTFRDNLTLFWPIATGLVSIVTLIITIRQASK